MDKNVLEKCLNQAVTNLFQNQKNIYDVTSETGETEWNLAHHLANEIHRLFPTYDCDLDVIKRSSSKKRPDIILHKRGKHESNFLVIELKKNGNKGEIEKDRKKIQEYWFGSPLKYHFGATINLKTDKTGEIEVLENNR